MKRFHPPAPEKGCDATADPSGCVSRRQVISSHLAPTPLVRSAATWAEGIMTRVPFDLTFGIIREHIDEIVLVSEEEMRQPGRPAKGGPYRVKPDTDL